MQTSPVSVVFLCASFSTSCAVGYLCQIMLIVEDSVCGCHSQLMPPSVTLITAIDRFDLR